MYSWEIGIYFSQIMCQVSHFILFYATTAKVHFLSFYFRLSNELQGCWQSSLISSFVLIQIKRARRFGRTYSNDNSSWVRKCWFLQLTTSLIVKIVGAVTWDLRLQQALRQSPLPAGAWAGFDNQFTLTVAAKQPALQLLCFQCAGYANSGWEGVIVHKLDDVKNRVR